MLEAVGAHHCGGGARAKGGRIRPVPRRAAEQKASNSAWALSRTFCVPPPDAAAPGAGPTPQHQPAAASAGAAGLHSLNKDRTHAKTLTPCRRRTALGIDRRRGLPPSPQAKPGRPMSPPPGVGSTDAGATAARRRHGPRGCPPPSRGVEGGESGV